MGGLGDAGTWVNLLQGYLWGIPTPVIVRSLYLCLAPVNGDMQVVTRTGLAVHGDVTGSKRYEMHRFVQWPMR